MQKFHAQKDWGRELKGKSDFLVEFWGLEIHKNTKNA
jgi:hypothetical protein